MSYVLDFCWSVPGTKFSFNKLLQNVLYLSDNHFTPLMVLYVDWAQLVSFYNVVWGYSCLGPRMSWNIHNSSFSHLGWWYWLSAGSSLGLLIVALSPPLKVACTSHSMIGKVQEGTSQEWVFKKGENKNIHSF
jgi:hypothetical protein